MKKLSELLSQCQSVGLNTEDENNQSFSSYASFYYDGEVVYVSIPSISIHVTNIEEKPKMLALFIEAATPKKSALERFKATLECDVSKVSEEDSIFKEIMPRFEDGALGILIGTQELALYKLTPTSGEVTYGLGETYAVGGEKMNEVNG
ncbi:MAG: Heme iron utilization protein [uncultured Sulfurovum sp.]|uniref:Heme iron utilization protein n=1 Tax=uncultured Sulfurovum sp. TaxID=269237 RepID=A0A6S6S0W3_9BACT|nr:MAG: Heme iron utilization protein [uncultured Sulfurovum sp.]